MDEHYIISKKLTSPQHFREFSSEPDDWPQSSYAARWHTWSERMKHVFFILIQEIKKYSGNLLNVNGVECPSGFECPAGNRFALECERGHYCNEPGLAKGHICPPGYFCPAGTVNLTDELICNFPFYCPAGSSYRQPCPLGSEPLYENEVLNR